MRMKRVCALLCVTLLACFSGMPAMALIKVETESVVNTFSTVGFDVELIEEFDPEEAQNLSVGQEVSKKPKLKNTGTVPEYLVMKVKYVSGGDTAASALKSTWLTLLNLQTGSGDGWTCYADGDDYFIAAYDSPVDPGECTSDLFTGVRISSYWTAPCDFDILLTGAAIQAQGTVMSSEIAVSLFE